MPRIAEQVETSSPISVWENPQGFLIAVHLKKVSRESQPFILNGTIDPKFNRQLYAAIDAVVPGAAVTSGYGDKDAVLQISIGRSTAQALVGDAVGSLNDALQAKMDTQTMRRSFREIEGMIVDYLKENEQYIHNWRRVII